jgi:hypothetical protein
MFESHALASHSLAAALRLTSGAARKLLSQKRQMPLLKHEKTASVRAAFEVK